MIEIMTTYCMDIRILIRKEVQQIEIAPQVDVIFVFAMILWFSKKQSSVSLSTAEANHIATCSDSCEAIWLHKLMLDLFDLELDTTVILCDNHICTKMIENHVFHDKSNHIDIRYFYIRDMV